MRAAILVCPAADAILAFSTFGSAELPRIEASLKICKRCHVAILASQRLIQ